MTWKQGLFGCAQYIMTTTLREKKCLHIEIYRNDKTKRAMAKNNIINIGLLRAKSPSEINMQQGEQLQHESKEARTSSAEGRNQPG